MSRKLSQKAVFSIALVLLVVVIGYNIPQRGGPRRMPPPAAKKPQSASVRVISVNPQAYQAQLPGFASAQAHYTLSLNSRVSGQISSIASELEIGHRVSKGSELITLENSSYQAEVAAAEAALASAQVSYLEAQREAMQAQDEWKASGMKGEPDSTLTLHKPQLASAKAAVESAQAALASARKNLADTHIRAPFDALVSSREVALGSYVQAGNELASLLSTDRVEFSIALSSSDWQNLPSLTQLTQGDWEVDLHDAVSAKHWKAVVIGGELNLDDSTRQRALIVAVDNPLEQSPALYPGSFVQASIPGRRVEGLWQLPASALSQRGEIWYVTEHNTLASLAVEQVFSDASYVYIQAPEELAQKTQSIVVQPLGSYVAGMPVTPLEVGSDE